MPAPAAPLRSPLLRYALLAALCGSPALPLLAQTTPVRPDSVVVPSPAADSVRAAVVAPEPPPDADPTPGPVKGRARWTILGACVLITISTLLLYNVRSR